MPDAGFAPIQDAPEAPAPKSRSRSLVRDWGLRIGVIAVFVVGGLILRDRLTGAAADLRVGDCFDRPGVQGEVSDVQHQPCGDPHDAEVVFVGDYEGESFPVVSGFDDFVFEHCVPAFNSYTGLDWESAVEYGMGYFSPTLQGWNDGDRELSCYVYLIDETQLTRSVKGAG